MTKTNARRALLDAGFAGDDGTIHDDRVVIRYWDELTFEKLAALSEAFGTKRIDLGIDHGCGSDPSADPYIIVWGEFVDPPPVDPAREKAELDAWYIRNAQGRPPGTQDDD